MLFRQPMRSLGVVLVMVLAACAGEETPGDGDPTGETPSGEEPTPACEDGETQSQSCGGGERTRQCEGGQWSGWSGCPGLYKAVAVGRAGCGIRGDGTLRCWGDGAAEPPAGTYTAITSGSSQDEHLTCALRDDGRVACWGSGSAGQRNLPTGELLQVTSGGDFACGIRKENRQVVCWGNNDSGQASPPAGEFKQIAAAGGTVVSAPGIGPRTMAHVCGVRVDGSLDCWGNDAQNQANPPGSGSYEHVAVADTHSCAVTAQGTLVCWGSAPTTPTDLGPIQKLATSGEAPGLDLFELRERRYSCAIKMDGTLRCWGSGLERQPPPPAGKFTDVSTEAGGTCARRDDGALVCWSADDLSLCDGEGIEGTNPCGGCGRLPVDLAQECPCGGRMRCETGTLAAAYPHGRCADKTESPATATWRPGTDDSIDTFASHPVTLDLNDDDWLSLTVADTNWGVLEPEILLEAPAGYAAEICAYYQLYDGTIIHPALCEGDATRRELLMGDDDLTLCCQRTDAAGKASLELDLDGAYDDESGSVHIRIAYLDARGDVCAPLTVKTRF
jgi:hypothetical protein